MSFDKVRSFLLDDSTQRMTLFYHDGTVFTQAIISRSTYLRVKAMLQNMRENEETGNEN